MTEHLIETRRWGHRIATTIVSVGAVVGVVCVLVAALGYLAGVRVLIFTSGSMGPAIPAGAIAFTVPIASPDIRPGQIISVTRSDGVRVTHRAVHVDREADRTLVTMRGDANSVNDAAPYNVTNGADRVVVAMPGVGKALVALREPWVLVCFAALAILAILPGRRARRPAHSEVSNTS